MNKLKLGYNKTLKLKNVLCYQIDFTEQDFNFELSITRIQNYIRAKGAKQIGPIIQFIRSFESEKDGIEIEINFMVQCDHLLKQIESPYVMKDTLSVSNCMYCRYIGPEDKLNFAYDKIRLEAFEKDILLKEESYTIYIEKKDIGEIVADVFMECKN